jgi:hypothetical protein
MKIKEARSIKNQSALEYFSTYGWALLFIAIIGAVIFTYLSTSTSIVGSTCTLNQGAYCTDMIIGSNSITHHLSMAFVMVNEQQYPLGKPKLFVNINGTNTTQASCQPTFVPAGGTIICVTNLKTTANINTFVSGSLYLNATDCSTAQYPNNAASCATSGTNSTFAGSLEGHVQVIPSIALTLSLRALNSTQPADGAYDPLYATLDFYGYPLPGGNIPLTVAYQSNSLDASSQYFLSPTSSLTNSTGMTLSRIWSYTPGTVVVSATFGNSSAIASTTIQFVTPTTTTTTVSGASPGGSTGPSTPSTITTTVINTITTNTLPTTVPTTIVPYGSYTLTLSENPGNASKTWQACYGVLGYSDVCTTTGSDNISTVSGTYPSGSELDYLCVTQISSPTTSVPVAINGECGSAPDGCISGTPTSESTTNDGNIADWTCAGSNGGTSAQCSLVLYGVCDPETPVCSQYPACYDGYYTNFTYSFSYGDSLPTYTWDCSGYYDMASCRWGPYMGEQCTDNNSITYYTTSSIPS